MGQERGKNWSETEKNRLKLGWGLMPLAELAAQIGRTTAAVRSQAVIQGLSRRPKAAEKLPKEQRLNTEVEQAERRLEELAEELSGYIAHPDWNKKVAAYHALSVKLSLLTGDKLSGTALKSEYLI